MIVNPNTPVRLSTSKDGPKGAFSVSTDDGHASGFSELLINGLSGTFVMNGTVPPSHYFGMFSTGMELGRTSSITTALRLTKPPLRHEIEANIAGVAVATQSLDDVISFGLALWGAPLPHFSINDVSVTEAIPVRPPRRSSLRSRPPAARRLP